MTLRVLSIRNLSLRERVKRAAEKAKPSLIGDEDGQQKAQLRTWEYTLEEILKVIPKEKGEK